MVQMSQLKEIVHTFSRGKGWVLLVLFCFMGFSCAGQRTLPKDGRGARVLFTGDSLMESMGPQMQPILTEQLGWSCLPIGKKSTGLCRSDFYNWPEVLEKNLRSFRPHLVVMWVGTNDNQNVHGVKTGGLLTDEWKKAYYRKMMEIAGLCRKYRAELIFIGPPDCGGYQGGWRIETNQPSHEGGMQAPPHPLSGRPPHVF